MEDTRDRARGRARAGRNGAFHVTALRGAVALLVLAAGLMLVATQAYRQWRGPQPVHGEAAPLTAEVAGGVAAEAGTGAAEPAAGDDATGDDATGDDVTGDDDEADRAAAADAHRPETAPAPAWLAPIGRSPIPQPGERFDRPLPVRWREGHAPTEVAATRPADAEPPPVVPWHEAHRHPGRTITAVGRIVDTHNTGEVCFLNFHEDHRGRFYIILFREVLDAWPEPPQRYFLGRTIRVTGQVRTHRGTPQIQVRDPAQIEVVAAPEPAERAE